MIDLSEHELDMYPRDAWSYYAKKHEQICISLVTEIIKRSGQTELLNKEAVHKGRFIEHLLREVPESRIS